MPKIAQACSSAISYLSSSHTKRTKTGSYEKCQKLERHIEKQKVQNPTKSEALRSARFLPQGFQFGLEIKKDAEIRNMREKNTGWNLKCEKKLCRGIVSSQRAPGRTCLHSWFRGGSRDAFSALALEANFTELCSDGDVDGFSLLICSCAFGWKAVTWPFCPGERSQATRTVGIVRIGRSILRVSSCQTSIRPVNASHTTADFSPTMLGCCKAAPGKFWNMRQRPGQARFKSRSMATVWFQIFKDARLQIFRFSGQVHILAMT